MNPELLQAFIPIAGLLAVGFAIFLARDVLSRDTGTKEMMDVSATINEGAVAFIKRQYTTIGLLALAGAVVIGIVIALLENTQSVADTTTFGVPLGIRTGGASEKVKDTTKAGKLKKDIARIKTIIREQELKASRKQA